MLSNEDLKEAYGKGYDQGYEKGYEQADIDLASGNDICCCCDQPKDKT